MEVIETPLVEGSTLTNAEAVYYIVPAEARHSQIARLSFVNTGAAAVTVTVYAIPAGQTSGVSNKLISNVSCGPDGFPQYYDFKKVLNPGTTIAALASTTGVVAFFVDGVEVYE